MNYLRFSTRLALLLCGVRLFTLTASAHTAAQEMAAATTNFLAALTAEQQTKAVFQWKDEQRYDWHFIPRPRKGLPLGDMTSSQRMLAQALLSSGLSSRGFAKAATIISLEQVLYEMESHATNRNSDFYYFSIFGKPGPEPWGWRVEGHHLSLNFAVRGEEVMSVTPSFFGSNPGKVPSGPRQGLRVLGTEEDLGRQLVKSLDNEQQKIAILTNDAPREVITGNDRKARVLEPMGLQSSKFNSQQKEILLNLLKEYVYRYRPEIADADLKVIRDSGDDKLYFAWAGSIEVGQPHYYRVQGPGFLMEYDNTQNNANHIHTVWRDLKNDFGEDTLRAHYEQTPHAK